MAQYVYTMRRVSKVVPPKRTILKNISLNFFPGAKIGVLGLNGSGKSSLLRIMAGVDDHYEGEVIRMPGIKVGFLEQEPRLPADKSVRQAVEEAQGDLAAANKRLEEIYAAYAEPDADFDKLAEEQARLEALINAGGADELEVAADALRLPPWEQKVDVLSGGEKRRVALCRLLLSKPDLLLLDEPTAGVDPKARREFWGEIHKLAAEGMTVLVSTHYMDEAERCHEIAYIAYGELLAQGTIPEVIAQSHLRTYTVTGPDLQGLAERMLGTAGIDMVAPFGNSLHVAGRDADALDKAVAAFRDHPELHWSVTQPSLEDVFISLMTRSRDNFQ
jgi:ABC-type multidrug transport system ATPase subunit